MKIGFYLAYKPHWGYSLKSEGLGRYLINLISLLHSNGCEICVACPLWMLKPIKELCEEYNFSIDNVEFITPKNDSVLWRLIKHKYMKKGKEHHDFKFKIYQASYSLAENIISLMVMIKSQISFALLVLAVIVCGIIALPFYVVYWVLKLLWKITKKILSLAKIDLSDKKTAILSSIPGISRIINLYHRFVQDGLSQSASEKIRMDAVKTMIRKIKAMKKPADIWYSPMAFWPEFSEVPGTKVTCFPDLIPALFPVNFGGMGLSKELDKVRQTVKNNDNFIVYSEYQKNQILSAHLGVEKERIISIPLSVNDTFQDLNNTEAYSKYFNDSVERFSRRLLSGLIPHSVNATNIYLNTKFRPFSFENVEYIFYASQCRPNKNMLTLIKAYRYLLREKGVTFKLILTASFEHYPPVNEYVIANNLQSDVIAFRGVSNQELAALYACAKLVVNPTIFEGGFPMTFAEGMAVGTPSVMGSIPQVTDVLSKYDLDDCLFDPFNYLDVADKILYGVNNRQELYNKQLPLYKASVTDTNEKFGKEYINAFRYFIELEKKTKEHKDI